MAKKISAESLGLKNTDQHVPQVTTGQIDVSGVPKLNVDVISDEIVTLDIEKAGQYIDLPIFPGERQVSDAWVQTLYDEMRKGTFNERLVVLSTAVMDGVTFKINGQHTCWAIAYMPSGYSIQVREIKYRVKDKTQLKTVYSTYDRLNGRSDGHIGKVILTDMPVMEGIWPSVISKLLGGLKLYLFNADEAKRVAIDQLTTLVQREHFDLFRKVAFSYQMHHSEARKLMLQPVVAAMYATFEKVPTKAEEFWTPVLYGTGLDSQTDARYKLRKLLLSINESRSKARTDKVQIPSEELFILSCVAWNRWRKGERVQALVRTKERPKLI